MQKFFVVIALVALLGVTSAELTNGSYAVGPKEVANTTTDPQIVGSPTVRLISSGSSVLLQGVVNATTVAQKTISTKDLGASDNKTISQSGWVEPTDADEARQAYDTVIVASSVKDNNQIAQIRVNKYKLSGTGATNSTPQDITSNTNNQTVLKLVKHSAIVHPGTKRFYVAALSQDNGTNSLVLVGVEISGTSTTRSVLSTNVAVDDLHVSCAGIAGQKQLYCVWNSDKKIFGAKVDPSTDVAAADIKEITDFDPHRELYAWSASNSYGSLIRIENTLRVRSSNNNFNEVSINVVDDTEIVIGVPRDDLFALILSNRNKPDLALSVQYISKNGTDNGTVTLAKTLTGISSVFQHSDGSLYISEHVAGQSVAVGQVWGSTHLGTFTLQAAIYACIALVAGLFAF